MAVSTNRKTGGGSLAVGGSLGSSGPGRVLFTDAAGTALAASADFRYDDATDQLAVGGAPAALGIAARFYAVGNANDLICFAANQNHVNGQAGLAAFSNSGPDIRVASCAVAAGANFLGLPTAGVMRISSTRDILLGSSQNFDVSIGTNDLVRMTIEGDGSGIDLARGTSAPVRRISNATATFVAGEPALKFGNLTGAVVCNLAASASYKDGAHVFVFTDGTCSGANTVTVTPNGADTIGGSGVLNTAKAFIHLMLDKTAGEWMVIT